MIVAMVAVRMVQVAVNEIVDVIAVWNGRVAAIGAVLVPLLVLAAIMRWRAGGGVGRVNRQCVFLDLAAGDMMQMAVVQVIDVPLVEDAGVPAVRAVLVVVTVMLSSHC
jgi:hypothetical protein